MLHLDSSSIPDVENEGSNSSLFWFYILLASSSSESKLNYCSFVFPLCSKFGYSNICTFMSSLITICLISFLVFDVMIWNVEDIKCKVSHWLKSLLRCLWRPTALYLLLHWFGLDWFGWFLTEVDLDMDTMVLDNRLSWLRLGLVVLEARPVTTVVPVWRTGVPGSEYGLILVPGHHYVITYCHN